MSDVWHNLDKAVWALRDAARKQGELDQLSVATEKRHSDVAFGKWQDAYDAHQLAVKKYVAELQMVMKHYDK